MLEKIGRWSVFIWVKWIVLWIFAPFRYYLKKKFVALNQIAQLQSKSHGTHTSTVWHFSWVHSFDEHTLHNIGDALNLLFVFPLTHSLIALIWIGNGGRVLSVFLVSMFHFEFGILCDFQSTQFIHEVWILRAIFTTHVHQQQLLHFAYVIRHTLH